MALLFSNTNLGNKDKNIDNKDNKNKNINDTPKDDILPYDQEKDTTINLVKDKMTPEEWNSRYKKLGYLPMLDKSYIDNLKQENALHLLNKQYVNYYNPKEYYYDNNTGQYIKLADRDKDITTISYKDDLAYKPRWVYGGGPIEEKVVTPFYFLPIKEYGTKEQQIQIYKNNPAGYGERIKEYRNASQAWQSKNPNLSGGAIYRTNENKEDVPKYGLNYLFPPEPKESQLIERKKKGGILKNKMNSCMCGGPLYKKKSGGKIHIKPENKGKFTASAKKAGMGVQEFAGHVLANKDKYSSTQVKRANFARNASKWKH